MRNRGCGPGSFGATECNQSTCGPGCQARRSVLRSGATSVPEIFQIDRYDNVASAIREPNNGNLRMYSQGRSLHHPSCNCANCSSRGHHLPKTSFKDLLYRQSVGVGESTTRLRSSQSHSHSQQNGYDRHCCGVGPSFYQGKQSADNLIERLRSTPKSSVFSAPREFEQRNSSASAGFMSHAPFKTKANESSSSSLDTTSKVNFPCPEKVPPGALKKQISLHGWYLMKPTSGDKTLGCLPLPGVAVGGYSSPQLLQTEIVQTARVEKRLEKSKLRTSDGMEVSLVGMIDLNRSIANGFSPALVKQFLIGFPSRWIYMMLNLNIRGSMPDLPSSSVQHYMDNFAVQSQEPPVEAIPVPRTPTAPFFTPPSEGTWREALCSFSPTTLNSLPAGSSDINTTEQCGLDQEQSEGQRTCSQVYRGAYPHSDAEVIAVENTDKVLDDSSQTGSPRRPGLMGDTAGEAGKDPDSLVVVNDVPALTPVSTLGQVVNEVAKCLNHAQETQVVSDCPNSVVKMTACCEGPQNAATEEGRGVVDVEDFTVNTEGVDHGHDGTKLPSVQVPFTPLQTSRQQMGDLNKQNEEQLTRETDPVRSLQNLDTPRKLRSGRCLYAVDKQMREQGIVREVATETTNNKKRRRNRTKDGMQSEKLTSSTEDLLVHREDIVELGGLDQAPSTPAQKITRPVNVSPEGTVVVDTPTTDVETHPVRNPQNADDTKKLRSGRNLRPLDEPIQELVADIPNTDAETRPVTNLQNIDDPKKLRSRRHVRALEQLVVTPVSTPRSLTNRKRRRISPSAAPVACEDAHSTECEEHVSKVGEVQGYKGETEVNGPTDESRKEPAEVNRPVNKKRHGKVSKLYRSRRKKSCPESKLTLESSRSDSCNSRRKILTVGVDKSFHIEETEPTTRNNSTRIHQSPKTTGRDTSLLSEDSPVPTPTTRTPSRSRLSGKKRVQAPNRATSTCTSQAGLEVPSGKRNSIVPPPLPAPRVADASKVIEAYGLKKSRFGRILVPPLAAWCNQSIIYDADGSIIAISDAFSSEAESQTGCFNFTFPSDTGARKMQKKLRQAAQTNRSRK